MIAAHGTRGIQGELYGPAELGIAARSRSSAEHRQKITLRHTACSHRIPIAGAQWARRRGHRDGAMAGSSSRPTTPCEMRRRGTRGCRVAALPMHAHNAVPPESSCVFSVKPPPSPVSHQLHVHVCLLCGTVGGSLEARANRHVASSLQPPPRHSKYSVPLRNELTSENPFHGSHRPFSQSI